VNRNRENPEGCGTYTDGPVPAALPADYADGLAHRLIPRAYPPSHASVALRWKEVEQDDTLCPMNNPANRSNRLLLIALLISAAAYPALALPGSNAAGPPVRDLQSHPDWPKARSEDTDTVNHITQAFFDSISAAAGGKLDRQRLNSLFLPSGRIQLLANGKDGRSDVVFVTPDQYADMSDSMTAKTGFFDREIAMQVQRFDAVAQVFVSYESRNSAVDPKPFVRGVKSLELVNRNGRWYLVSVAWERETPATPIPSSLLQSHGDSGH
jgi:hypothetical protein